MRDLKEEEEREQKYEEYAGREGDIVTGIIQQSDSRYTLLDLGRVEALLPRAEQVPNERPDSNTRIKAYIVEVRKTAKGPQIVVSRTHPGLIKRLFELEVPEIADGIVEIRSCAREPGHRTKIAVWSNDPNVDPVGACVGASGARVRMIVNELRGEKIDIVPYSEEAEEFVSKALSPAKVKEVRIDMETGTADVIVPDYQLSLAIGKEGQNARLSARLTGWRIDIKSETQQSEELVSSEGWRINFVPETPEGGFDTYVDENGTKKNGNKNEHRTKTLSKMISSNEILTLINALGLDPKVEEIELKDLRYGKIIIMTDADVDGSHIRALLLTFLNNKPFNKLIENGHVYLAQPPLFKINKGSKGIYIKDEKELEEYIVSNSKNLKKMKKGSKDFIKAFETEKSKISIQRFKGLGEMNPDELWNTTLNPETRNLLQVQYSKDQKKDQNIIHTLMGNDVSLRKEFIVANAINVSNLDI